MQASHEGLRIRLISLLLALFLLPNFAPAFYAEETAEPFADVNAGAAVMVDVTNGAVLYKYKDHEPVYPASTTKMMTALLIIEACEAGTISMSDVITASNEMVNSVIWDASHVSPRIKIGEKMTVEQMLHCVMIESDCAACNMLAEHLCGTVDAFVALMNQRAAELGCDEVTHFSNAHGYTDPTHVTTAWSLYLIAAEGMKHSGFADIVSKKYYTIPATNLVRHERLLSNTNWLLGMPSGSSLNYAADYYYEGAIGIKTGYTSAAGNCLVSCAEREGRRIITVITGTASTVTPEGKNDRRSLSETIRMLDHGFDDYSVHTYLPAGTMLSSIAVVGGGYTKSADVISAEDLSALLPLGVDYHDMTVDVNLDASMLTAPIPAGSTIGTAAVTYNGVQIGTVGVVTSKAIEEASEMEQLLIDLSEKNNSETTLKANVILICAIGFFTATALAGRKRRRRRGESAGSKRR